MVVAAGCGSAPPPARERAPRPRTIRLGWREVASNAPRSRNRFVFEVRSLTIGRDGWSARVAFRNESSASYTLGRAGRETVFGLETFESARPPAAAFDVHALVRGRLTPTPPNTLRPGERWSGTLRGPPSLLAGDWVRVAFGTFVTVEHPPPGLPSHVLWLTDHTVRLD
jgi:hypothetical protein